MKKEKQADIAVVGAGIIGLSIAYTAAKRGHSVVLFERNNRAIGASIRNFGLIWPIGQAPGRAYERALRSREIWSDLADEAGFYKAETGCLHLAYHQDELNVLTEFVETAPKHGYQSCELSSPVAIALKSKAVKTDGLLGGMWSNTEITVDPREAIAKIPPYLASKYKVELRYGTAVNRITMPFIETKDEKWHVGQVYVCSGADFETLYPEVYANTGITKCKLQMMRTASQPGNWQLGPALCAGLTLRHYNSFKHCASLAALDRRILQEYPEYEKWGIHVLLSQTSTGELTIGDSHEYGLTPEPFDREEIERLILDYLDTFAHFPDKQIVSRWHGIYPKLPGKTEFIAYPEKDVVIINGLSGAGMTLSFGLAEELVSTGVLVSE